MANPQPDKVIRVSEDLMEAIIQYPFGGRQLRVVLAVMRKTYRYGKKSDWISHGQLAKLIKSDRGSVAKTVRELVEKGVLAKRLQDGTQVLGIQKDYEKWKVLAKRQRVGKTPTKVLAKHPTPSTGRDLTEGEEPKNVAPKPNGFDASAAFSLHFWPAYPKRNGVRKEKGKSLAALKRHATCQQKFDRILVALTNYANHCETQDEFPKDACRWIPNWKEWEEITADNSETVASDENLQRLMMESPFIRAAKGL